MMFADSFPLHFPCGMRPFLVRGILERHFARGACRYRAGQVAVEKPGHDAVAIQVDDARLGPHVKPDLGAGSQGENTAVPDRDRLGLRLPFSDDPHLATREHQLSADRQFRVRGAADSRQHRRPAERRGTAG